MGTWSIFPSPNTSASWKAQPSNKTMTPSIPKDASLLPTKIGPCFWPKGLKQDAKGPFLAHHIDPSHPIPRPFENLSRGVWCLGHHPSVPPTARPGYENKKKAQMVRSNQTIQSNPKTLLGGQNPHFLYFGEEPSAFENDRLNRKASHHQKKYLSVQKPTTPHGQKPWFTSEKSWTKPPNRYPGTLKEVGFDFKKSKYNFWIKKHKQQLLRQQIYNHIFCKIFQKGNWPHFSSNAWPPKLRGFPLLLQASLKKKVAQRGAS